METNTFNVSHLDSDALLPPHKRLLANLKKQVPDFRYECETRQTNIKSHLRNPNISSEEIVEASKRAAVKAAETARAKRAHAEQKAAKAAKAVTSAKCALELVSALEEVRRNDNKSLKRKSKCGYHSWNRSTNCEGEDEEITWNLGWSVNSSPRVSKSLQVLDISKGHKRKMVRLSSSSSFEKQKHM